MVVIRAETPADVAAIRAVHLDSFPSALEARLVELLRDAGHLVVSLVAEIDGVVVGHVGFSPVSTAKGSAGVGLAPIAVLPGQRRQGIAGDLVTHGLDACAARGYGWAVVLGDENFYSRFSFVAAPQFGLFDEYGGGDAFQIAELLDGSLPVCEGLVRYGAEFASLG